MKTKYFSLITAGVILTFLACNSFTNKNLTAVKMQSEVTGSGRPIVLVPGGLTGWVSWEPFVQEFSKKRTVIRVQLLGVQWGLEDRPIPEDYSVKAESRALAATLDSLDYRMPVDLVAWSYGAFAALDYALDNPERIRTLTLIEPPAMWVLKTTGRWDDEVQETANLIRTYQGEITEDMLAEHLKYAGFIQPGQSARELPQWNNWIPYRRSLRINPFVVSHHDDLERLKKFQPPTLLIKGTGSTEWLHHVIDGLSENIPNSQIVEFPGGHAPHIVSRDSFLVELEKFQNNTTQK
jgi:pimeloyl-ACP methyl ester carboxylesterase